MVDWDKVDFLLNIGGNAFTILASGLAIGIFLFNLKKINYAFSLLLNYTHQLTLSELKMKVERLNDFSTDDAVGKLEIINILSEIEGQIEGSKMLTEKLKPQKDKIAYLIANDKRLKEPLKRSLISNLRESIRDIDVTRFNNLSNN